ncbi:MAG: translation initiation factor IF-3 [Actinobacteria bacterium]|nr:translation initiation factor IF-3 [Actinomycetota bacterium]
MLIATDEARINDRIRAREVRLIGAEGEQLGTVALPDALRIAREAELDLVEVAPNNVPPVCKIMDFGRWQYEQEQRRKESRKKATNVVIKEMKFRPKIDIHDYTTKMRHVQKFLGDGNKVKLTIMFRGREMAHPELGRKILDQIATDVVDYALVESAPRQDGRNMTMVLHPVKKAGKAKPKVAGKGERGSSKAPAVEAPATPAPSTEAPVATEVPEAIVPVVEGAALDSAAVVNEVVVSEVE